MRGKLQIAAAASLMAVAGAASAQDNGVVSAPVQPPRTTTAPPRTTTPPVRDTAPPERTVPEPVEEPSAEPVREEPAAPAPRREPDVERPAPAPAREEPEELPIDPSAPYPEGFGDPVDPTGNSYAIPVRQSEGFDWGLLGLLGLLGLFGLRRGTERERIVYVDRDELEDDLPRRRPRTRL